MPNLHLKTKEILGHSPINLFCCSLAPSIFNGYRYLYITICIGIGIDYLDIGYNTIPHHCPTILFLIIKFVFFDSWINARVNSETDIWLIRIFFQWQHESEQQSCVYLCNVLWLLFS